MGSTLASASVALLLAGCSGDQPSFATGGDASPIESAALLRPAPRTEQVDRGPFAGFTLVAPLGSKRVHLIDMAGEEVHRWDTREKAGESNYLTSRGTLIRCAETPDHPTFQDTGGHGGGIFEYGVHGEVLWEFRWDSEGGLQHHDVEELPNGNFLFVAWDRTTRDVALAAGRDPELLEGAEWWTGAIYEVKPTRPVGGEIVWSWHSRDHLVQNYDSSLAGYGDPASFPGRIDVNGDRDPKPPSKEEKKKLDDQMRAAGYAGGDPDPDDADADAGIDDGEADPEDESAKGTDEEVDPEEAARAAEKKARKARTKDADWTHMNAVDYNADLDQIAISVRKFDEIWIIDHGVSREEAKGPAGDLLYRFGNAYAYGMGRWSERRFLGQHNVQWIPKGQIGAGNLIVFNNGARPRPWSSVVEWWPPLREDGTYARLEGAPFGPSQYEWSYQAEDVESFYAPFISGVQRLPNGNTLLCSGPDGLLLEVTQEGETVWQWQNAMEPFNGDDTEPMEDWLRVALFRATRYGVDSPEIAALRAAGAPVPASAGAPLPLPKPEEEPENEPGEESEEEDGEDDSSAESDADADTDSGN